MPEGVASTHQIVCGQGLMLLRAFPAQSACCTTAWQMQKETLRSILVNVGWWMRTVGADGSAWPCYRCWFPAYGATHRSEHAIGVVSLVGSVGAGTVLPSLWSARMKTAFIASPCLCWVSGTGR
jgi:hypothetical protein